MTDAAPIETDRDHLYPSRTTALEWVAARLRVGDDPHGIAASFNAFVRKGGVGSIEEALGLTDPLSLDERIARRNALLVKLYDRYQNVEEQHRASVAHRHWTSYFNTKWKDAASKIDGGHQPGCLDNLFWQILTEVPRVVTARTLRDIARRRK